MNTLKLLRKRHGYTQKEIADVLGITDSAYNHYESGRVQISIDALSKLADFYKISADVLLGRDNYFDSDKNSTESQALKDEVSASTSIIPILGRVLAGYDGIAEQEIIGYLEIEEALQKKYPDCFALRVGGKSMEPEIHDGDTVIVRPCSTVKSGDVAIVCINGDEGTIKRVKISDDGITVIPTNPIYKSITYTPEQVENLPVMINGQVVQVRHNYY